MDWDRIAAAGAVLALTSLLLPASGPAGGPVRVMPLGDSITQGRANRFYVETAPTEGFDHDHEGHWGWRAEEVLARIGEWAGEAKPDVVLIHLGTNDIGNGQGIENVQLGHRPREEAEENVSGQDGVRHSDRFVVVEQPRDVRAPQESEGESERQ